METLEKKYFSKKATVTLLAISIVAIVLSSILILFSNQFYGLIYEILSKKVFHREFDFEKWLLSIESFFLVPIFVVIVVNALIFVKYSDKSKTLLLSVLFADLMVMILYTNYAATDFFVDSDLASEILLGKECVKEKTLWPKGWYYSTEFRFINTQFFSALGFLFTNNFNAVKTIQTLFCVPCLFFAMWFLLNQISIKKFWLKFLTCILTVIPWSWIVWHVSAGENYYIPHAVFSLIYVSLFIKITQNSELKHKKFFTTFFFVWAFLSGLSSIRYIIIFVLPLTFAILWIEGRDKNSAVKITDFKGFWLKNQNVFLSVSGLILSGVGYVFNNLIFQKIFTFHQWNSMNFNKFGETTLSDILLGLLETFGFKQEVAVLTPSGVINCLVYAAIFLFVLYLILALKKDLPKSNKIVMTFFVSAFLFNTFLHLNVDYINRYYYPIIIYVLPCIAIIVENSQLSALRKWTLAVVWSVVLITSSFSIMQHLFSTDANKKRHASIEFIQKKGYEFGYATFWNSTVATYLTDGDLKIGNLTCDRKTGKVIITPKFDFTKWLAPKDWYTSDYGNKPIFLLVEQVEYENSKDYKVYTNGKLVYEDEFYKIYEYPSHEAFKKAF